MESTTNLLHYFKTHKNEITSNEQTGINLFCKMYSYKYVYNKILEYVFNNDLLEEHIKITNIDDALELLKHELNEYKNISGCEHIEDENWIVCNDSTRFKIKHNQKGLYNTTELYTHSEKIEIFLNRLIIRMKSSFDVSSGLKIYYKIYDDTFNKICWIVIVLEHNQKN